ncbi:hypothetical protein [Neorhizobium alkalisoli]|uniref:hypothetical protein n=1 Tax=Neorhizobium alkalisoli TaxID=528178 RepID=UPI001319F464|nr:hypothetical protein [Neorhizobium alkalisoli]
MSGKAGATEKHLKTVILLGSEILISQRILAAVNATRILALHGRHDTVPSPSRPFLLHRCSGKFPHAVSACLLLSSPFRPDLFCIESLSS